MLCISDPRTAPVQQNVQALNVDSSRFETLFNSQCAPKAENYLREMLGGNGLGTEFDFAPGMTLEQHGFDFAGLRVRRSHFGAALSARNRRIEGDRGNSWFFMCNLSASSQSHYATCSLGPGEAACLRLKDFARAASPRHFKGRSLIVQDDDMQAAHRALYGPQADFDLEFERKPSADGDAVATLMRIVDRLASTPQYPHRHVTQLERALKESALFELLLAWPGVRKAPGRDGPPLPASTRLARDYIHAHLSEMPTVADIASHCRVGVRALDRGFRRHLGASPWQYMLELRLQAVREDLLAGHHGGTVTVVAMRWGFSNLGTFAARYRELFGELPSETLRKRAVGGAPRRLEPRSPKEAIAPPAGVQVPFPDKAVRLGF